VRDEGDRLLQPDVTAQQITGPTATCRVYVSSNSCANFLSTSCQVCENGGATSCQVQKDSGERQGRPTTTSRRSSSKKEYGTDRHVWSRRKFKQLRNFFFQHLAKFVGTVVSDVVDRLLRPKVAAQQTMQKGLRSSSAEFMEGRGWETMEL
jgi:hypothetical protein